MALSTYYMVSWYAIEENLGNLLEYGFRSRAALIDGLGFRAW